MKRAYYLVVLGLAASLLLPAFPAAGQTGLTFDGIWPAAVPQRQVKRIPAMIADLERGGTTFAERTLFGDEGRPIGSGSELNEVVNEGRTFDLDRDAARSIIIEKPDHLRLSVPAGGGRSISLKLAKVNILAAGFGVRTSGVNTAAHAEIQDAYGLHYRGIIDGDDQSLAAISIFPHEVMGMFARATGGNMVLGRLGGKNMSDRHILYRDTDLRVLPANFCNVDTPSGLSLPASLPAIDEATLTRCVRLYVEGNFDLFQEKGSVPNTIAYITGFFNQSSTLIANTGINVLLSEIFVWNTPSPFTSNNATVQLQTFGAFRTTFNGDFAHLVDLQPIGGVAFIDSYCDGPRRYAYSGVAASFANLPAYSNTVQVFTHEIGHNLGSQHTHACVWNGNNTAIDGCAPVQGACSRPDMPAGGGTIMSYCNLQAVGINFSLGFGPQPGDRVFNRFNAATCLTDCSLPSINRPFDYDGDARSDISVFRPSDGAWFLQQSRAGFFGVSFGSAIDKIAPADYDGDGKTDIAVYRPSTGIWYVTNSSDGTVSYHVFGIQEDLPTPADHDGDGRADIAVFRPSSGTWYRLNSRDGAFVAVQFGQGEDRPTIGDFDGDGKADIALFRPSSGAWYQINSSDGSFSGEQFGNASDKVVPADFDGDRRTDIAIYRPSEGLWYYKNSSSGTYTPYVFGLAEDIPAAGDFDGDGKADIAVFRPSDGTWYIVRSSNGSYNILQFGQAGDRPTQSAFLN